MTKFFLLAGIAVAFASFLISVHEPVARAQSGACGTSHDALSSEEQQFASLIQGWRDSSPRVPVSTPLQTSGALNAAAAWYAQWQVENGTPGGHYDNLGRRWGQRALDCGYVGTTSKGESLALDASGEGTFAVSSSANINLSLEQALAGITYPYSGVELWTPSTGLPAKCIGVGIYENEAGTAKAWIVLIAQYPASSSCPGSTAAPAPTQTSTASPTASPTPPPTATATPRADGAAVTLWLGWNLVTLPAGTVPEILTRAGGCFRAVYKQEGDQWLRYSPVAPAYANNLHATTGGTFWVEGTANCGLIQL